MVELTKEETEMKVVYNNQTYDYDEFRRRVESNGFARGERIACFVAPPDAKGEMGVYIDMTDKSRELERLFRQRRVVF